MTWLKRNSGLIALVLIAGYCIFSPNALGLKLWVTSNLWSSESLTVNRSLVGRPTRDLVPAPRVPTSVVRTIEAGRIYELPDNDGRINRCQVKETLPLTGNLSRHFTAIYRCDDDRSRSVLIHVNTRGFVGFAPNLNVIQDRVNQA